MPDLVSTVVVDSEAFEYGSFSYAFTNYQRYIHERLLPFVYVIQIFASLTMCATELCCSAKVWIYSWMLQISILIII